MLVLLKQIGNYHMRKRNLTFVVISNKLLLNSSDNKLYEMATHECKIVYL